MIYNLNSRMTLAANPVTALGWRMRLCGMIGRRFVSGELDAMVFPRCNCVHSIGMTVALDLLFLDVESTVTGMKENYPPWALFPCGCRKAAVTIELPAGTLRRTHTKIGDKINLNLILPPEKIEKINPGAMLNADILPRAASEQNEMC